MRAACWRLGMISRERTGVEVSEGRDVGCGVRQLAVGAGEAGTAEDGPSGGNCHHAKRVRVKVRVRIRVKVRPGLGLGIGIAQAGPALGRPTPLERRSGFAQGEQGGGE